MPVPRGHVPAADRTPSSPRNSHHMMLGLCWLLCSPQSGRAHHRRMWHAGKHGHEQRTTAKAKMCAPAIKRGAARESETELNPREEEEENAGRRFTNARAPGVISLGASRAKRARADGVMNGARAPRRPGARRGGGLEKRHLYLVTAQRRLGWTRPRMETAACGRTHMPCLRTARGLWVPHVM